MVPVVVRLWEGAYIVQLLTKYIILGTVSNSQHILQVNKTLTKGGRVFGFVDLKWLNPLDTSLASNFMLNMLSINSCIDSVPGIVFFSWLKHKCIHNAQGCKSHGVIKTSDAVPTSYAVLSTSDAVVYKRHTRCSQRQTRCTNVRQGDGVKGRIEWWV